MTISPVILPFCCNSLKNGLLRLRESDKQFPCSQNRAHTSASSCQKGKPDSGEESRRAVQCRSRLRQCDEVSSLSSCQDRRIANYEFAFFAINSVLGTRWVMPSNRFPCWPSECKLHRCNSMRWSCRRSLVFPVQPFGQFSLCPKLAAGRKHSPNWTSGLTNYGKMAGRGELR